MIRLSLYLILRLALCALFAALFWALWVMTPA